MVDPLGIMAWISVCIDAAGQAPATKELNMGVLQA